MRRAAHLVLLALCAAPATARADVERTIEPTGAIAGGMRFESLHQRPGETAEERHPTVAVSRLGVRGTVGDHVSFASELEASLGGGLGYGASVWEGQAALAVRSQYLRYTRGPVSLAAGRIVDETTFDFTSAHVADLLLTDVYTRDPLLFSGADRGTGLFGTVRLSDHVSAGLSFHSTNPTGITGTLIIGGELHPFDRPFYLAAAQVGRSQTSLPDQNLHIYFATPSVSWRDDHLEAKAAVQLYTLDTQMAIPDDDAIRGYNLRASLQGRLVDGRVRPFVNASRNENEMLDTLDATTRVTETYRSYVVSGGVDYDYRARDGVGLQYAVVDMKELDQHVREHYLNLATTYWVEDTLSIGVRAAVFARQVAGDEMTTGHRSLFVTGRLVL